MHDAHSRIKQFQKPACIRKGQRTHCFARGVFIPIEDTLIYTPLEFCGQPVDAKTRESFERNKETIARAKRRSEAEKAKIRAKEEKQRKERALFWDEFLKAFRFQVV